MHSWHSIRQGCIIFQAQSLLILFISRVTLLFFLNLWLTARTEGWEKKIWKKQRYHFLPISQKKEIQTYIFCCSCCLSFRLKNQYHISAVFEVGATSTWYAVSQVVAGQACTSMTASTCLLFFWALIVLAQSFQGMTIVNIIFVDTKSFSWR